MNIAFNQSHVVFVLSANNAPKSGEVGYGMADLKTFHPVSLLLAKMIPGWVWNGKCAVAVDVPNEACREMMLGGVLVFNMTTLEMDLARLERGVAKGPLNGISLRLLILKDEPAVTQWFRERLLTPFNNPN